MNFSSQLLFFFSALGVFNGLLLALFLWRADKLFLWKVDAAKNSSTTRLANRFLSLMLLMICLRIGKSVFLYFSPDLAKIYLQIGLSACFMIGPFLYFYINAAFTEASQKPINLKLIKIQTAILLSLIAGIGLLFPYESNLELWGGLIFRTVNLTWFVYLILAWQRTYQQFTLQANSVKSLAMKDFVTRYSLEVSVLAGNSLIWLAYYTSRYTSYIAGALSFSFVTYLTLIVFFRQRNAARANLTMQSEPVNCLPNQKYSGKLDENTVQKLSGGLAQLMVEQKLFTDANLTLPVVAKKLSTNVPVLSQFLNDNLNTPFTQFVNEYRINEAKQLLLDNPSQSIEVIAELSGFNSQSTFYTAFKKITDTTPARFREQQSKAE